MLNAFRHHGGRHLAASSSLSIASKVLNAFRHHGGRHGGFMSLRNRTGRVLNAFRHHGGRHARRQSGRCARTGVLNAFRHHGGRHGRSDLASRRRLPVLNAFRHHGGRHVTAGTTYDYRVKCSTPFGITEGVTRVSSLRQRHCRCAQRLSASRRASPGDDGPRRAGRHSAQRLSASRRASQEREITDIDLYECSTPFGITEGVTTTRGRRGGRSIRAQRLSASRRASRLDPRGDDVHREVLNAFRHHGGRHPAYSANDIVNIRCSTPFGITEGVTTRNSPPKSTAKGAQRLSASRRASPRPRPPSPAISSSAQRLSASRRASPAGTYTGGAASGSAQRLSASRRASLVGPLRPSSVK